MLFPATNLSGPGPERLRGRRVGPILARSRGRTVWADPGAGAEPVQGPAPDN